MKDFMMLVGVVVMLAAAILGYEAIVQDWGMNMVCICGIAVCVAGCLTYHVEEL